MHGHSRDALESPICVDESAYTIIFAHNNKCSVQEVHMLKDVVRMGHALWSHESHGHGLPRQHEAPQATPLSYNPQLMMK